MLGFRDRVRVKVRVSFRVTTFMYSVWPPVSVRVSLGFRDRVRVKVRVSFTNVTFTYSVWLPVSVMARVRVKIWVSFIDSLFSCILYNLLWPLMTRPSLPSSNLWPFLRRPSLPSPSQSFNFAAYSVLYIPFLIIHFHIRLPAGRHVQMYARQR